MKKSKYKPTDPELFKVTLFPLEPSKDESLRKSIVERVFIRIIMEGMKDETSKGANNDSE